MSKNNQSTKSKMPYQSFGYYLCLIFGSKIFCFCRESSWRFQEQLQFIKVQPGENENAGSKNCCQITFVNFEAKVIENVKVKLCTVLKRSNLRKSLKTIVCFLIYSRNIENSFKLKTKNTIKKVSKGINLTHVDIINVTANDLSKVKCCISKQIIFLQKSNELKMCLCFKSLLMSARLMELSLLKDHAVDICILYNILNCKYFKKHRYPAFEIHEHVSMPSRKFLPSNTAHDTKTIQFKFRDKHHVEHELSVKKIVASSYIRQQTVLHQSACPNIACKLPMTSKGKFEHGLTFLCAGDAIIFTCDGGYHVRGGLTNRITVFCSNVGTLSTHPICEKKTCELPKISNGKFDYPGSTITSGKSVRFTCDHDFYVTGTYSAYVTVKCSQHTGLLSMKLSCKRQICDVSSLISNQNNLTTNASVYAGNSVKFSCPTGFVVRGTIHSTLILLCLASGNLAPAPICQAVCFLPQIFHGSYVTNASILHVNSSVVVECEKGYVADEDKSSSFFQVTCVTAGGLSQSDCVKKENSDLLMTVVLIFLIVIVICLITPFIISLFCRKKNINANSYQKQKLKDEEYQL